MYFS
jgi:hypothetical protein